MDWSTPGFLVHHQLLELAQTRVRWVGDAIQPSHPLSSPSPPALNLSGIRVFSNESVLCIKWPKYQSFSFSISPFNECSGLISFRMDWLDLLAVQGTLKSLLQHHSKASILQRSAFFMVQLSSIHNYWASQVVLVVKNPPANARDIRDVGLIPHLEMQVQPLGQKDPLEEGTATHSTILALRIPWTEEPGRL